MQSFQGLIKNRVDIPRETKKKSCKISSGLDFLALEFLRDVTLIIIPNFQGWSFVFPGISRGTENNNKNFRAFPKKVCPQTPLIFFWNSPIQSN